MVFEFPDSDRNQEQGADAGPPDPRLSLSRRDACSQDEREGFWDRAHCRYILFAFLNAYAALL